MFSAGLLMNADDLRWARGVHGMDFVLGFDALAGDDQVIFAAQLTGDQLQCGLHLARIFRRLEIGKGLIGKPALRRARLNRGSDFWGSHSPLIVADGGTGTTGAKTRDHTRQKPLLIRMMMHLTQKGNSETLRLLRDSNEPDRRYPAVSNR